MSARLLGIGIVFLTSRDYKAGGTDNILKDDFGARHMPVLRVRV